METKRLLFRPWEDSDAPVLYRWASDPDVGPMCGWKPHESVKESLEIILRGPLSEPETYALVLKETGEPVGSIGLFPPEKYATPLPLAGKQLEMGYWVAKSYWGRELCPEAAEEMAQHAFEDLGCVAVHCSHFDFNGQSKRVIEKLGSAYRLTRDTTDATGKVHSTLCYVLLREEWERR